MHQFSLSERKIEFSLILEEDTKVKNEEEWVQTMRLKKYSEWDGVFLKISL